MFIAFSEPWKEPFTPEIPISNCNLSHNSFSNAENHWGLFSVHREINGELYKSYFYKFVEITGKGKMQLYSEPGQCDVLFDVSPESIIQDIDRQALKIDLGSENPTTKQINVFHKATLKSLKHSFEQPPTTIYLKSEEVNIFEDIVIGVNCGDIDKLDSLGIPEGQVVDFNDGDTILKVDIIPEFFANCIPGTPCTESTIAAPTCPEGMILIDGFCQKKDDDGNDPEPIVLWAILGILATIGGTIITIIMTRKKKSSSRRITHR